MAELGIYLLFCNTQPSTALKADYCACLNTTLNEQANQLHYLLPIILISRPLLRFFFTSEWLFSAETFLKLDLLKFSYELSSDRQLSSSKKRSRFGRGCEAGLTSWNFPTRWRRGFWFTSSTNWSFIAVKTHQAAINNFYLTSIVSFRPVVLQNTF